MSTEGASYGEAARLFDEGGPLASAQRGFERREGQRRMAEAVEEAFAERGSLVVEAGTGTGKTLAYLVPALFRDGAVILSTGTRALQDQLVERELPTALRATGSEARAVVLKGRTNYLCLKRLEELEAQPSLDSASDVPLYRRIVRWSRETEVGDRAEIPELPDVSPLWSRLDGRSEICIGQKCPHYESCFVVQARRRAASADVVVVNHHLLFADLALRDEGHGLLPEGAALVLDEAHLAEEAAAQHFGERISLRMVVELARDAREELAASGRPIHPCDGAELAGRAFFEAIRPPAGRDRVRFEAASEGERAALAERTADALGDLADALAGPGERADERALLASRAVGLRQALESLAAGSDVGRVVTAEPQGKKGAALASYPVEVGPLLEERFGERFDAVVATSATLSVAGSLELAKRRLGLSDARGLLVDSPFDHERQAGLYVPREFPEPSSPSFLDRCLREIEELVSISRGRALVIFASHRALAHAAERLRDALPYRVLVQGDAPRERLVEAFRSDVHSVLLGTATFRQGIDVPGDALSLVIVDKLPFAVPDDPVQEARAALIRERGGNPFRELSLPEAILRLRQSFGRLVRRADDGGLLALLDVRVRTKSYGRTILDSLPGWTRLDDLDEVRAFEARRRG